MTYHERIDGCPDLTPDGWRQINGPLPGERHQGITRAQIVARHRAEFLALTASGEGVTDPPAPPLIVPRKLTKPRKLSGAPIGRPRQPVISDRGETFSSARAASRAMGRCDAAVAVAIARGSSCGGRTWRYLTREELSDAQDTKLSA
jgi:hypothetical protein